MNKIMKVNELDIHINRKRIYEQFQHSLCRNKRKIEGEIEKKCKAGISLQCLIKLTNL